jgi:hypothetical protein
MTERLVFGYYSEFRFREAYKFTLGHLVCIMLKEHVKTLLKNLIELLKSKNCIL